MQMRQDGVSESVGRTKVAVVAASTVSFRILICRSSWKHSKSLVGMGDSAFASTSRVVLLGMSRVSVPAVVVVIVMLTQQRKLQIRILEHTNTMRCFRHFVCLCTTSKTGSSGIGRIVRDTVLLDAVIGIVAIHRAVRARVGALELLVYLRLRTCALLYFRRGT